MQLGSDFPSCLAGFSDRAGRGPLCLDCNHVGNVTECDTVRLCSLNQV